MDLLDELVHLMEILRADLPPAALPLTVRMPREHADTLAAGRPPGWVQVEAEARCRESCGTWRLWHVVDASGRLVARQNPAGGA